MSYATWSDSLLSDEEKENVKVLTKKPYVVRFRVGRDGNVRAALSWIRRALDEASAEVI